MTGSTGGPLPYLDYCGVEVANSARTVAYIRNGLMRSAGGQIELGDGDLCGVLYRLNASAPVFTSPVADPAPWYDPAEPGASSFLGLVMLGIKGYDSTIARAVTNRITGLGGGTFGGQHRLPRTWSFRAAMISSDDVGAEYGLRWLTAALQSACDDCAACDLTVRLSCPPADGSNDDLGKWTSYDVALIDGPHEVEPFINQYADADNMAGCRDVVIVEWTMQAGNPFLYKPPVACLTADIAATGQCYYLPPMLVTGTPITDAMRALNQEGDGLPDTDSGYGIWQGSTNFLRNGSAEIPLSVLDWLAVNVGGGAITRVSAQAKFGSYSVKVTAPGSLANEGVEIYVSTNGSPVPPTTPAATQVIFSVWLRGEVGGELLSLTPSLQNTDASTTTGSTTNIALTTDWQRFTVKVSVAGGKTANGYFLVLGTRGATFAYTCYVDGAQIEAQGPGFASPFILTTGASAARTKARVQATVYPDILSPTLGWVAFRVRMGWPNTSVPSVGEVYVFEWTDGTNKIQLTWDTPSNSWKLHRVDGGGTDTVAVADTFTVGQVVTVVATWDATHLKLSIDGAAFTSVASTHTAAGLATILADLGSHTGTAQWIDSDILWFGGSRAKILTDADAATIYALAPSDPSPQQLGFDIGTGLEAITWPAETAAILAAVPTDGICSFLFGPTINRVHCPVTPPAAGTIAPIYTVSSVAGIGGLVFESYETCPPDGAGTDDDDPVAQLAIAGVPAGYTVIVDCAKQTITLVDPDGNETDGQSLLVFNEGRALEWPQADACDAVSCFTVGTASCAIGDAHVVIETQIREG